MARYLLLGGARERLRRKEVASENPKKSNLRQKLGQHWSEQNKGQSRKLENVLFLFVSPSKHTHPECGISKNQPVLLKDVLEPFD